MSLTAAVARPRPVHAHRNGSRLEGLALPPGAPPSQPGPRTAGRVSRPRLVSRLTEGRAPVALVVAPAGYGKTTLVTEWEERDRRPFAWVAVDRSHGASGALVAAIEEALDDVAPPSRRGRGGSTQSHTNSATVALARLTRSLDARPPFVLVLDDLHVLEGEGAHEAVRTLARHVPPGSVLALATRAEPALPVGRLRANRALTEVRAHELAMTAREAASLIRLSGATLADADLHVLADKAEGWPAGLYLAALALRGQADSSAAVARFGGDDAIVADYLREEMLEKVPADVFVFLLRSSTLARLSGPVCDFVLERSGSAALLDSLARAGLLVPIDRAGEEFHCHGLLAQMLRAELRRTQPEAEGRLHRRASDWYAQRADVDRAMHHAVAAGDAQRAGALLMASAPEYVSSGRNGRIERWLASFTAEQIAAQPGLTLAAANSHLLRGDLNAVQRWESAARRTYEDTPPAQRSAAHEASVALLHAAVAREDIRRMGEDAARAYELEPEDSPWRALCCLLEGVSLHLQGQADRAEARLEEGVRRGAVAAPNVQTLCLAQLALVAIDRDDWDAAAGFSARALAQVEHYTLGDYPSSALVFAVAAAVRARRGRVEEAQEAARESSRLLRMLTDFMPWYEVEARIALASASARLSDSRAARQALKDAARLARRMPDASALHEAIERVEERLEAARARVALLTTAELRILGFLPTHLSFREIAARLYVSANTVKTQAHAVYRKLDAASRSEAVANATRIGLLDS